MSIKTASLAVSILVISFFFIPQTAMAIESGGIGGKPAYPRPDNPKTESIFVHTLGPGINQEEGVIVINNTPGQKTLSVYATDSTPSSGGGFACKQFSEPKTGVGSWISLRQATVILEPNTNVIIPFTITIPQFVDVGEHNGCIVIQEVKPNIETQKGMSLAFRSAIRVAITIPGEIIRNLKITGFTSAKNKKGVIVFTPKLKNLGNTSLSPDIAITTHSVLRTDILQQKKIGGKYLVLRDDISELNFELDPPFWGGWYRSNLLVNYDSKQLNATLIFFSWPVTKALVIEIYSVLLIGAIIYFIYIIKTKKIRFQIVSSKKS